MLKKGTSVHAGQVGEGFGEEEGRRAWGSGKWALFGQKREGGKEHRPQVGIRMMWPRALTRVA